MIRLQYFKQLAAYTRNYSTKLGSGGFGEIYKVEFPNGAQMAVKVPNHNNSISKRVEEQFMAGVSTIGRTYYRNLVRLYGFFSILISGFEWRVIGGIIGCHGFILRLKAMFDFKSLKGQT
ncbi:putative cysteine-rich receptor-like protein kinase 16 [Vitis vinifera]|uniref:Putative cysteine-rich receptor-like protein kinase 16 n=1 Tax=Vitis vinifera TaxID=29760 RepID=A0A438CFA9_VITVI|nr:putative cysteine-rich receptor-like protein kinase 16 [Vitis vinifera]